MSHLLAILAHPDDECFAFGGALALAVHAGHTVTVICATDGQSGSYRGTARNDAELAAIRREEFVASCAILGVQHHELLGYVDGQLERHTLQELGGLLVARIRTLKPDVVLTFGLDGSLNTHPDHTAISAAASAAFHWAAYPKRFPDAGPVHRAARLWHQTTSYFLPGRVEPSSAPWSLALDVRSVMDQKLRAFEAHTTQRPLLDQVRPVFLELGTHEHYALMASHDPAPVALAGSLFPADGL